MQKNSSVSVVLPILSSVLTLEMIPDLGLKEYQLKFCCYNSEFGCSELFHKQCHPFQSLITGCHVYPANAYPANCNQVIAQYRTPEKDTQTMEQISKLLLAKRFSHMNCKNLFYVKTNDKNFQLGDRFGHQLLVLLLKLSLQKKKTFLHLSACSYFTAKSGTAESGAGAVRGLLPGEGQAGWGTVRQLPPNLGWSPGM